MSTKTEIPTPIYAVAGAGEVAYEKLRELPAAASRTLHAAGRTTRAWRKRVAAAEVKLDRKALATDLEKVREAAQRNAAALVAGAAAVQERAATGYRHLVDRGVRLIDGEPATVPAEVAPVPAVAATPAPPAKPAVPGKPVTPAAATPTATATPAVRRTTTTAPAARRRMPRAPK